MEGVVSVHEAAGASEASSVTAIEKVAMTWADHFGLFDTRRQKFIEHYLRRNTEDRFWCIAATVNRRQQVLLRLDGTAMFYNGQTIQVAQSNTSYQGAIDMAAGNAFGLAACASSGSTHAASMADWRALNEFILALPCQRPKGAEAKRLIAEAARQFRRNQLDTDCMAEGVFGALTSFCRAAADLADSSVCGDAGRPLNTAKSSDMRFVRPRRTFYLRRIGKALKDFSAHLDADILRTLRSVACPSAALYNWIASGDVVRRIQAVQAYPILLPMMVLIKQRSAYTCRHRKSARHAELHQLNEVARAVDAGEKILPLLTDFYRNPEGFFRSAEIDPDMLPQSLVRTAARVRPGVAGGALGFIGRDGWNFPCSSLFAGVRLGNRAPVSRVQWRTWFDVERAIRGAFLDRRIRVESGAFYAGMPGWDSPVWPELIERIRDLRDLKLSGAAFLEHHVLIPRLEQLTLKRLLKLSVEWHQRQNELQVELTSSAVTDGSLGWVPMLPGVLRDEATGVEIHEIDHPLGLDLEGTVLEHCVGGYAHYCYEGEARIISLRKDGVSLATAEYGFKRTAKKRTRSALRCNQLRGRRNAALLADSAAGKAFRWFESQLRAGAIEVNLDWPVVPHEARSAGHRDLRREIDHAMTAWLRERIRQTTVEPARQPQIAEGVA
ncbi:hypothetical protein [Geopseudomonas aromaticivorans]